MNELQKEFGQVFERLPAAEREVAILPPINMWEDAKNVYLEVELPGFKSEDLEIHITPDNHLTITGNRSIEQVKDETAWHRRERMYGRFSRVVTLPVTVDEGKIDAKFQHGVLSMTLPKSQAAQPRRIAVAN
jgi:HSP20 family protein